MTDVSREHRPVSIALLAHPLVLLAVFVTAVNDHLLKDSGWLPGIVTGKLSDITGLFFFPILLAVLLYLAVWAATALVARAKPEQLFDTRVLIDAGVVLGFDNTGDESRIFQLTPRPRGGGCTMRRPSSWNTKSRKDGASAARQAPVTTISD